MHLSADTQHKVERAVQASPTLLKEMEACARALASSVGYVGAATVEFLYGLATQQYYFLELNPRLQVCQPGSPAQQLGRVKVF